jgi:hypothetical protein
VEDVVRRSSSTAAFSIVMAVVAVDKVDAVELPVKGTARRSRAASSSGALAKARTLSIAVEVVIVDEAQVDAAEVPVPRAYNMGKAAVFEVDLFLM